LKDKDIFDLTGRTAIITGGFGQLGRQFALELLSRGMNVALFGRHVPGEAALAAKFPAGETRLSFHSVDITNKESLIAGLAEVVERWGTPHVLINNAGIDTQPSSPPEVSGPFEFFPEEVFRQVVEVNLTGTFLSCQVIGGAMAAAGRGSIINIGSIYGIVSPVQDIYAYKEKKTGIPFIKPVAYSASKSGLVNLTHYLGTYWAKKGVKVNLLTPAGVFRSDQDAEFQRNYCERIPIGRMARENEYNGAVVFLASDASSYMTGANLIVDGGWTSW
jgi:NAD(P)-dependent dehydrogenase (short-subunit alcohol dehydrogenase family)